MRCNICGKEFGYGNREDGLPNGMTFVTANGNITMCADCIMEMGRRAKEDERMEGTAVSEN